MDDVIVYYEDARGFCPLTAFLDSLKNPKARDKCLSYISRLVTPGPPLPKTWAEKIEGSDRLWELKPEWGNSEYRMLYAQLSDGRYLILHGVVKKGRRLRAEEFRRAEERLIEYERRMQQ